MSKKTENKSWKNSMVPRTCYFKIPYIEKKKKDRKEIHPDNIGFLCVFGPLVTFISSLHFSVSSKFPLMSRYYPKHVIYLIKCNKHLFQN